MLRIVLLLAAAIALTNCQTPGPGYELPPPERSRPVRPAFDMPIHQQGAR